MIGRGAWLLLLAAIAAAENGWQPIPNQAGIDVAFKEIPGSPVIALKGEGTIDAPLDKVVAILVDDARAPEWMEGVRDARVVRQLSATEYVEYFHIGTPPLMRDRDFVLDVRLSVDPTARTFTLVRRSVEDPAVPPSSRVRASMDYCVFVLHPIDGGTRTALRAEIHADPKGWLPKFAVNYFQKGWPIRAFAGIRRQAAKTDITRPSAFAEVLDEVARISR